MANLTTAQLGRMIMVLEKLEWDQDGRCPICTKEAAYGHTKECAVGQVLHPYWALRKDRTWREVPHKYNKLCADFSQFARITHQGRYLCEKNSNGMAYIGSCSLLVHAFQLISPDSWVHSSVEGWYARAEEQWEKGDHKVEKPKGPGAVEK